MDLSNANILDTGYRPRPLQEKVHRLMHYIRFLVLVCHRRFGKTVLGANHIIDSGWRCPHKNPQYAYIAPTYTQAKRVAWEYFKDYTRVFPKVKVNASELKIEIPRMDRGDVIKVYLLGAESPDSLRGMYLDGVILDEYALFDPMLWSSIIRPALSDRLGWGIFIGTPKGRNHFYDLYAFAMELMDKTKEAFLKNADLDETMKGWAMRMYRASETGIIPEAELAAAKLEMSKEEYEQEYECSFNASLVGSYYGRYLDDIEEKGQICHVAYDSSIPVMTYWDLGMSDSTAIWFVQYVGKERHVIDYLEDSGRSVEWYMRELQKKGYYYGEIVLPHDANARELTTGKQRVDTFRDLAPCRVTVLGKAGLMDGINAVRNILPMCWFDKGKTFRGLEALRNYRKEWDGKRKMFSDLPKHDWSSHGADAFRTFAMGRATPMSVYHFNEKDRVASYGYDMFGF